jgi:ATP-binding cassette subfamily B protein
VRNTIFDLMTTQAAASPEAGERTSILRPLASFLALVWAADPALTLASLALRMVRALLPLGGLYVGKLIIDAVVAASRAQLAQAGVLEALWSGRLNHLAILLGIEFAIAVATNLLARGSSLVDSLLAERFSNVTSLRLMRHAATLDLEQLESSAGQDRLDRARRQVTGRTTLLSQLFGQAQDALTVISLASGLALYAPWLIVLLCVALVPGFFGEKHFNALNYRLDYFRTPERRQLDYLRYLGSSTETAKEVKLFGLSTFLAWRFDRFAEGMYSENRRLATLRAAWGGFFAALATLGYYAAYFVIVWHTVEGRFTIGDLTFLAGSFLRLRGLLEGLLLGFSQVAGQALYVADLFAVLDARPAITAPPHPLPVPHPIRDGFVFEDVGFRYDGAEGWAVRHLDLTIRAGETLALVGRNGAGKTTIVKLMARLYDPTEGRVLLDGRDLKSYDLDELRARIGVIFQDFVRFHFTAADNIGVGRVEAREDAARVEEAAVRSLADRVITRLPLGYAQPLGRRFNDGVDLSGGEWQTVAIARAYMRDADVLILDEPTAALDARAEYEVFQRFGDLARGRTAVLISHRFSTVRMADRILVLDGGKVIEDGSHEALLQKGGRYAELFALQAAGYR